MKNKNEPTPKPDKPRPGEAAPLTGKKFDDFVKKVLAVPKAEIDARQEKFENRKKH